MKKILLFLFMVGISFFGFTYAVNKFTYESALQLANDYIKNSSFDENWKNNNPQIVGKGMVFHTDNYDKHHI